MQRARFFAPVYIKERKVVMKKIAWFLGMFAVVCVLAGCSHRCESEPIVESNHKLIVPPNFGNMPK